MLRLNPSSLSNALGRQLLTDHAYLRHLFEKNLIPLIAHRYLDKSLQRINSGSITVGSALSLFLLAHKSNPVNIAEVGTYIGTSSAAIAYGATLTGNDISFVTCDMNPCTQNPFLELDTSSQISFQVFNSSSSEMFREIAEEKKRIDFLHLDGRLQPEDFDLLKVILKNNAIIVLDDCEGDEKGHINLHLLRSSGLIDQYAYVEPFNSELFRLWGIETRSTTGVLLPANSIFITRQ